MMTMLLEDSVFRLAEANDADSIAQLHANSWRKTYRGLFTDAFLDGPVFEERTALWRDRFATWDTARNGVILMEHGKTLLGFASIMLDKDPDWGARLENLHVHAEAQGTGAGRQLMQHVARWVLEREADWPLHLMVFERNERAVKFYDAMGGTMAEKRDAIVEDGTGLVELRYVWRDLWALAS
jgi:GNAT superfamily N-acetyltransferase